MVKRALIVGCGSIARRHIKNLRLNFPLAEIICMSSSGRDINIKEMRVNRTVVTLSEAVSLKPDIVIVASPAPHHLAHAKPFLKRKIPVLIEKPLCASYDELAEYDLNLRDSKVAVGYNLRYLPALKVVREVLDEGVLGKISSVFATVGQYLPDWRPGLNYKESVSAKKSLGGGALLELSHEIDYLNYLFGSFSEVLAMTGFSDLLDIDVEDSVHALLKSKTGIICNMQLDFLQRRPTRTLKIVGQYGNLDCDLIKNNITLSSSSDKIEVLFCDPQYNHNDTYVEQLNAFVNFSKSDVAFSTTIDSSIEVMRLIKAIRLSDQKKMWIQLS